jgi:hypothetical protein
MIHNRERSLLLISLQSCSANEPEFTTRKFKDIMRVYRTYVIEWEKQPAIHIALTSFPTLHTACSFDILHNLMSIAVSPSLYIMQKSVSSDLATTARKRIFKKKIYTNLYCKFFCCEILNYETDIFPDFRLSTCNAYSKKNKLYASTQFYASARGIYLNRKTVPPGGGFHYFFAAV